ncbi:MAG: PspC domain-containing protein [Spirochaetales bacterium]|nr:PspC domain-containing protein [Spirochaetales bacterium]
MNHRYHRVRKKLFRSRDGVIWGVCRGLAEWMDVPVGAMRLIWLAVFVFSGFFPIVAVYAIAALLMPVEPAYAYSRYR